MTEEPGLRERKKIQTRRKLWKVALDLFLERGFDKVSVAEIAAAADVSKMTVFNYCGTKEDLVVGPMREHVDDVARAVRERAPGESVVAAVRRQFLDALDAFDASVGMNDREFVLRVRRLIVETPSLLARAREVLHLGEENLATVLVAEAAPGEEPLARVVAAQLMAVRSGLVVHNHGRLLAGERAVDVAAEAKALAERAFDTAESGLREYGVK
ncbi:TetR family transcriptional regulator [Streptomyces sp. AV19]|uniref:TetR/AcrR family transcriptional regulator n=1 Tax=Streptomyces sp. AV19 TaxID=2793068 RepID=UPI0018FE8D68|nr:TetR/AcrR family transcriptional regulator [Streptomyces sp. AV19]MBH1934568.1 TetR family transcriptional regulator [Streptomyces sp. AV19]MDG4530884.1 TetR/AcrR family transcriptional regulator [Streptomyces sp. AV19]